MNSSWSQTTLTDRSFQELFQQVNSQGFAALDLSQELPVNLGESLYHAMDKVSFHPERSSYYNEISFCWPEDWKDVAQGLRCFHESKEVEETLTAQAAAELISQKIGPNFAEAILGFTNKIKTLVVKNHHGLLNNEIRLSRIMIRQMNEQNLTEHGASEFHEDHGYDDKSYQQILSCIVTTYGIPTRAQRFESKVGELIVFNTKSRREMLKLTEAIAFIHKGPRSGPKMFFFFEFLGPKE